LAYPNIDQDVTAVLQRKRTVLLPLSSTSGGAPIEKTVIDTATITCSIFTVIPSNSLTVRQGFVVSVINTLFADSFHSGDKVVQATGWVAPHVIYNSVVVENTITHLERSESFPLPTSHSAFSPLRWISTISNALTGHDHEEMSPSSLLPPLPPAASTYEHQLRAFVAAVK